MTDQRSLSSDQSFAVGEIVIMAVPIRLPESRGQEREIMGLPAPYKQRSWTGRAYGPGTYSLRTPEGEGMQAYPWQLRRKQQPDEVKSTHDEAETT